MHTTVELIYMSKYVHVFQIMRYIDILCLSHFFLILGTQRKTSLFPELFIIIVIFFLTNSSNYFRI